MISGLNLIKPVSRYTKAIAKKCGWVNADNLPLRKSILPDIFARSSKYESNIPVIGTRLNQNNVTVMEIIMANDKISKSPFVRSNMTEILKMAKTEEGTKMVQAILTSENVEKLDAVRNFVRRHPNDYIKDKSQVKYVNSPAGLNTLFNNVSMLKAAAVLDFDALNKLFKMDITQKTGKKLLDNIGELNFEQLKAVKENISRNKAADLPFENIIFASLGKYIDVK